MDKLDNTENSNLINPYKILKELKEEEVAEKYLIDNDVDVDYYVEKGLKEMKRIKLSSGATARVSKDCPKKVIDALNKIVDKLKY